MEGTIDDWSRTVEVLLVEDSPGAVRLAQEAFSVVNSAVKMHVVSDGKLAMAFLRHKGIHANAPRPDLILLDLNLPKMDGREVLALIKEDTELSQIPVVVLTTSEAKEDILISYKRQANCFLTKPVQLEAFEQLVKNINEFWLKRLTAPRQEVSA